MKIISLVVFVLALIGSWYLSHREQTIPEAVHQSLQNDLKRIITEYIQKNLPNAKNLEFKRFWTEDMGKNKVKASFGYSFDDNSEQSGAVKTEIEGVAILNKISETADGTEWSFDELHILNNGVEFKDALKITAHADADEAPAAAGSESATPPTKTNTETK